MTQSEQAKKPTMTDPRDCAHPYEVLRITISQFGGDRPELRIRCTACQKVLK